MATSLLALIDAEWTGFVPGRSCYRQNVDFNSPEFRRTFPRIVLTMAVIGLALVALAVILTLIGYNQT